MRAPGEVEDNARDAAASARLERRELEFPTSAIRSGCARSRRRGDAFEVTDPAGSHAFGHHMAEPRAKPMPERIAPGSWLIAVDQARGGRNSVSAWLDARGGAPWSTRPAQIRYSDARFRTLSWQRRGCTNALEHQDVLDGHEGNSGLQHEHGFRVSAMSLGT